MPNEGERLGGGNNEKERRAEGGKQMKAEERGGRGLVQEKPKIKNKMCSKTWPIGRFGRVRIQVRPNSQVPAIRSRSYAIRAI